MIDKIKEKIMQDRRIGRSSLEAFLDILKEVEAEYGNGWIPVEKALPKEYCHCLVTRKKEYSDGSFDYFVRDDVWIELEGCWGWQSEFEGWIENIIAWKPLPSPYTPTTD